MKHAHEAYWALRDQKTTKQTYLICHALFKSSIQEPLIKNHRKIFCEAICSTVGPVAISL